MQSTTVESCTLNMCPNPCKANVTNFCHFLRYRSSSRAFARTDGRHNPGQDSLRGIYTTISDPERIVYVPVGLGGRDGWPDDSGASPGRLGGGAVGLTPDHDWASPGGLGGGAVGLTPDHDGACPAGPGGPDGPGGPGGPDGPGGGAAGLTPDDCGVIPDGLGGAVVGLTPHSSAMMKAASALALWKTVPTEALKWQIPLL